MTPETEFRAAISKSGLTPPDQILVDGRIHRFPSNGKATDRAGWYIFYPDGIPAGAYGCWRTDLKGTWRANIGRPLTPAEEAAHQAKMDAARREREREEARRHAEAREQAGMIWKGSKPAPSDHPYLVKKGVKSHGLRAHEGALVIPVRDGAELHSLQFIGPEGNKRFLTGGRVVGCYFSIGRPTDAAALCICEGYATGASIHEATGYPVVLALNAGNLLPVAKAVRERFPELHLIVCADDDVRTPGNPGLTKATEAARAVGGLLVAPDFSKNKPEAATDLNDLHQHAGLEAVAACIAAVAPGTAGNSEANQATGNSRPAQIIDVRAGELPRIVQDAIEALRDAAVPIYDRGGALYRPVRNETPPKESDVVRRPVGALVLRLVDAIWVRVKLAGAARWRKWDARDKEMRPADPPRDIAEIIATQSDLAHWPVLRGVVSHPVLTPEGRVISTPGYDRDTGLLIEITGGWPIPDAPTRDDAVAACARLRNLLRHYPWVSEVDRAVGLSLLLTPIARPVLPAAPMHCVDSPEAGSGKSMLVDVASIGANGGLAPVLDYGRDPAEAGKRLDAMMLAGDPLIAIDNVEAPLEGAVLCQMLTQPARRIRVLGGHTVVTVPCVQMVTASGCNLTLRGDIVRRVIICRLDAQTERPELRDIDQDLIAEVSENRRELVGDLITVMLAYQQAGHPDTGVSPLGGFGAWSRMVRQALIWAGEADPCRSMDQIRGDDPSRQNLALILMAWHAAFGEDAVTVRRGCRTSGARFQSPRGPGDRLSKAWAAGHSGSRVLASGTPR